MAKKKHRSPSYPAVNLESAIGLAKRIYPGAKHQLGASVIAEQWGYNSIASASPYIAALKHFGLLDEEKSNGDRMLKFTDPALDILVDPECETEQCRSAIQDAAMAPKLHQDLWERWGNELPPDAEIRRYLDRDRDFNPKYIQGFIEQYKETLGFAGLFDDDTIREKEQRNEAEKQKEAAERDERLKSLTSMNWFGRPDQSPKSPKPSEPKMRELPITLPSLNVAIVKVPAKMSESDFQVLEMTIKGWKPALVQSDEDATPKSSDGSGDPSSD